MADYPNQCGAGEDMKVDGKVSIGAASATQKLEVVGNSLVQGSNGFSTYGDEAIMYMGDTNHYIKAKHGTGVVLGTWNAGELLCLKQADACVGIGTTSPESKLEVDGGDIEVDDSGRGLILRDSSGYRWRVTVTTGGALAVARV